MHHFGDKGIKISIPILIPTLNLLSYSAYSSNILIHDGAPRSPGNHIWNKCLVLSGEKLYHKQL